MLYEFIAAHRDAIITKAREKLTARPWPVATTTEPDNGVPIFLNQLAQTLEHEETGNRLSSAAISTTATLHGRDLLALGFTVSQVVQDYGDICQALTELAIEQHAPITTEEFHTLNRCLDTAMAHAVTEHARITAESQSSEELIRAGQLAHETRDLLNTALLAFSTLKRGTVAINGSTGAVLGRSLTGLRDLVDSALADVRMKATNPRHERVAVAGYLNDLADASRLHAEFRGVQFAVEPIDPDIAVEGDPQILASAVTNLLNNAFKFTRAGGRVLLRAHVAEERVIIEVEDECGGIPDTKGDPSQSFGDRRGKDRTGLGLGLSIARKAVRAHGGDIYIRNMPGKGCVFSIEVPMAAKDAAVAPAEE